MSTSPGPSRANDSRGAGARRRGRERALGLLYEAETKDLPAAEVLAVLPTPPERYAIDLFEGVMFEAERIDELIGTFARSWAIDRMPVVDRQLLRVATDEILCRPDVPCAVIIDEAIELAKEYSTEESGRFVNGILAAIARELRPDETTSSPAIAALVEGQ